ncbi:hypothetical protein LSAT2_022684 [Lamellibrachia satsuma]|nr:hypothetical protein LSAT2_022684 [Lamellibrachia satsuma]
MEGAGGDGETGDKQDTDDGRRKMELSLARRVVTTSSVAEILHVNSNTVPRVVQSCLVVSCCFTSVLLVSANDGSRQIYISPQFSQIHT